MTLKENNKVYKNADSMTIKYLKVAEDLMNDKTHPLPCACAACLYSKHKERLIHKNRKKYEKLTFFVYWLMVEIKISNLESIGKFELRDFFNAPYLRETEKVLKQLPESKEHEWYYLGLKEYIKKCFKPYLIRKRYYRPEFLKLLNELESEIRLEWQKTQPDHPQEKKKEWKRNWGDLRFAQRVADFIRSQSKKEVPQHLLLRHFNKNREPDLERIRDILRLNYKIDFHPKIYKGKKTGYYSTMKSSKGKYWRVGK